MLIQLRFVDSDSGNEIIREKIVTSHRGGIIFWDEKGVFDQISGDGMIDAIRKLANIPTIKETRLDHA